MNFKTISALILLALFIIICIQNSEIISVHLLFWKVDISKLLLLIITLIIGIFVGMILLGFINKQKKKEKVEKETVDINSNGH